MAYKNTLLVYEVFENVGKAAKREDKIKILRENDTIALRDVLQGMFDSRVDWLLPKGAPPPYEPADGRTQPANLLTQNKKFTYFVKGGKGDRISSLKREMIFIRLLESIHPRDAELLVDMINRRAPAKTLTKKLVEEAFPNLIR